MRICVGMVALLACKAGDKPAEHHAGAAPASSPATDNRAAGHCEPQPFAASTPLPEASGAGWLTVDGKLAMVVVADSGHSGDYALIDPETGETREQGKLPLGGGSDDLEGASVHGEMLYALASNGLMRAWQRRGDGFALVEGPYSVGATSLNFEGLAIAAAPRGGCAGFACSKGDGQLYCLVEKEGRYAVDPARTIAVTKPGTLADCTFDEGDALWVGNNAFGMDRVFRVDGWADPKAAKVVSTNAFGVGFPEVIAARGDVMYRFSDTGGAPSLMGKFRCSAKAR